MSKHSLSMAQSVTNEALFQLLDKTVQGLPHLHCSHFFIAPNHFTCFGYSSHRQIFSRHTRIEFQKVLDKGAFRRIVRTYKFDFDFALACPKAALVGAQAMWDQNISEWNKTYQNQHSTASTKPDPAQRYANGLIDEITCMPRICLSNHAEGTPVFVRRSDSKATLAWPTGSKTNSQHASQVSRDVWTLFRPSVQSMLLCECYYLAIPMMQKKCPGAFHSTKLGDPTIIRSILRKTTCSPHIQSLQKL